MNNPLVSIIMPAYNCVDFIGQAIQSILDQSYTHFELIIIDDCSTDGTLQAIRPFMASDHRIRLLTKEKNTGYTKSLNQGISNAQGTFIARLDADDIAIPNRIATQLNFLLQNPAVGVCGSWALELDSQELIKVPVHHEEIMTMLLFRNSIIHPSVMFRQELVNNPVFDSQYEPSEDFHLWSKLSTITRFHNIPQALIQKRLHHQQVSHIQQDNQRANAIKIMNMTLQRLGIQATPQELRLHYETTRGDFPKEINYLTRVSDWLLRIQHQNLQTRIYPEPAITQLLKQIWQKHIAGQTHLGAPFLEIVQQNPLSEYHEWNNYQKMKFKAKCLLRK
ncbi:hypothetical protein BKI52_32340 [marine bacterium AO1-C]|nr:hypothetical protein BKI52_32340 [marine bacterium AO1-C]